MSQGAGEERIRVLLIDDHKLFAEAIRPTLEATGMLVLEPVVDGRVALETIRRERPHLVLVDLGLPGADGMELGKQVLAEDPGIRVAVLTALNEPRAVAEALKAGFHGYLTKDTPTRGFLRSLQAILDGEVVIPHRLARSAAGGRSPEEEHAALLRDQLTARELDVLALLVEGKSTQGIARELSVSPNTVRTHVQNILDKLQVRSRLEAAAFAVRFGLVTTPRSRTYA